MARPIPHTNHPRWVDRPVGRFSGTIRTDSPEGCAIGLLGMPDDTGVKLNHGRTGAADGPAAFRRALVRYGVAHPDDRDWPVVYDAGDIQPAGQDPKAIHETHDRVTEAVTKMLGLGLFPVGIGGGHDLTFPFVRAVANLGKPLGVVYFDPHLDVREEVGSGMAFRALVERCGVAHLHNFGASDFVNGREHLTYFAHHHGRIHRDGECEALFAQEGGDLAVSFDLDLLDAAHAPGVSAMNPAGWSVPQAAAAVGAAGRCGRVRCFDIMELSPPHDQFDRTARVAAHLFLSFLWGFAERTA